MRFAVINFDVQIKRKKYIILSAEHQLRELSCSHAIKYLKKNTYLRVNLITKFQGKNFRLFVK